MNLSPQINGNYSFKFSDRLWLSSSWQYSYWKNRNSTTDQIGLNAPVFNSTDEEVNSVKIFIQPYLLLLPNLAFQFDASGSFDWFSTTYKGSANTIQRQARQEISSNFKILWRIIKNLRLSVAPGLFASLSQISDVNQKAIQPTINANIEWNPHRKFSLNCRTKFYMRSASASESNPVLVKSSDLLWLQGNPYLKNCSGYDQYLYANYLTSDWLTIGGMFGYSRLFNSILANYIPANIEREGLVKEYINAEPEDQIISSLNLDLKFNNFSLNLSPQYHHSKYRSLYASSFDNFSVNGKIDYIFNAFRIGLSYDAPWNGLDENGRQRYWKQDSWSLSFSYGNDNLYVDIRIENIFHNKRKSWTHYTSPNLVAKYNTLETGRQLVINLSYTFDYGKKVDKYIDIEAGIETKTSVLY